mmetsp:Transcript_9498/g.23767  ORF Transcript_9498/g.23767 Transcript_9498/m.23767 type:complete len:274 (+) Transcript_9498:1421-2242(+)
MMERRFSMISSMKGASAICGCVNLLAQLPAIFRKVSHAISCTPGNSSCMNSNNLLTTVFRNFQCARRKRGYWPTMYMILDAMTALLSFPRVCSHMPKRSLMTVTRKRFSSSSLMARLMDPIAQHSVFRLPQDHSLLSTCFASFSSMMFCVSSGSKCVKKTSVSRMLLYRMMASLSFSTSLTRSPFSSSTMMTSSGLAMLDMRATRTFDRMPAYSDARPDRLKEPGISRSPPGLRELSLLEMGACWYSSPDSLFQYSRQILNSSLSSMTVILVR